MNSAFGRELDRGDIYQHVTSPEFVYLLRQQGKLVAMASYNKARLADKESLIVEGIAVLPEMQGRGVFRVMTDLARNGESLICLRTQNPRMYRALEKCCEQIFPGEISIPELRTAMIDLARQMNCSVDENGVVRGYYGRLFYGEKPSHKAVDPLFARLGIDLNKGDGLLVVGTR